MTLQKQVWILKKKSRMLIPDRSEEKLPHSMKFGWVSKTLKSNKAKYTSGGHFAFPPAVPGLTCHRQLYRYIQKLIKSFNSQ